MKQMSNLILMPTVWQLMLLYKKIKSYRVCDSHLYHSSKDYATQVMKICLRVSLVSTKKRSGETISIELLLSSKRF